MRVGAGSIVLRDVPTWFGPLSVTYEPTNTGATLTLGGPARPPGGVIVRLPSSLDARVAQAKGPGVLLDNHDFHLPAGTTRADILFKRAKP